MCAGHCAAPVEVALIRSGYGVGRHVPSDPSAMTTCVHAVPASCAGQQAVWTHCLLVLAAWQRFHFHCTPVRVQAGPVPRGCGREVWIHLEVLHCYNCMRVEGGVRLLMMCILRAGSCRAEQSHAGADLDMALMGTCLRNMAWYCTSLCAQVHEYRDPPCQQLLMY